MSQKNILQQLPQEILFMVFSYLAGPDLCAVQCVNKQWSDGNYLLAHWRNLYLRSYRNWYKLDLPETTPKTGKFWKNRFKLTTAMHANWKGIRCKTVQLNGFQQEVRNINLTPDLLIHSSGSEILVWDIFQTHKKKYVLKQGADWIKTIQLSQDLLVTSSGPRNWHEIHVYKLSSGELQRKMTLESDVECVRFYDERQVVSAAAQLMMHDVETGQCALTFNDQKKGIVNAMAVEGSLVVCSHKGKKVRIWDVRSGRRVMTMATGHTHLLHDIGVVEKNKHWTLPESLGTLPASPRNIAGTQDRCLVAPLITVSKDESVRLFDMRQLSVAAKPLAVLTGHKGPVRCVRMDAWKAVTGAKDGSVIVWDLTDPELLHQSVVTPVNSTAITGPSQLFNWLAAGTTNPRPVLRVKEPVYTLDFCDSVMFTGHTLLTLFDFDPHSSALTRFTNRRRANNSNSPNTEDVDSLNVGSDRSCLIA